MTKIPPQRIDPAQAVAELPGWTVVDGRDAIRKTFKFRNFNQAFGFMSQVALYAERHDHHPEWTNVFNRVDVILATHEAKDVSRRDVEMALFMDTLA